MPTGTIRLIRDGEKGGGGMEVGEEGDYIPHAEISPRVTATRNGRRSADLPVVPEQPEPV